MDDRLRLFYVTVPSLENGERLAEILLSENLIACANIFPPHISLYKWNGQVERGQEHVVIFKTRQAISESFIKRIEEVHPYDCPCIIEIAPEKTNKLFLNWVLEETSGE